MDFLRFLENIRTPAGDVVFQAITYLGEETLFILLGVFIFWCYDKREGYFLLSVGFIGTVLNQFLKLAFRIPRPWVMDKDFSPVSSAVEGAAGYSFPSGHTQSAIGIFGGIARWNKQLWLRIVCISIAVLVPFSRMYLGVHTPLDVGVSVVISLLLIFLLYPLVKKSAQNPRYLRLVLISALLLSAAFLLYVNLYKFPVDTDISNYESGLENACKMFGCCLAVWLSFEIDTRYTNFDTKAALPAQFLKLVLGLIPVILIKVLLKNPLAVLLGNHYLADGIRYFLLAAFAGCIWPLTFRWFSKLFTKKAE